MLHLVYLKYICNMDSGKVTSRFDKVGILSAILCVIHCTVIPLSLAILANLKDPFGEFSLVLDSLFIIIALSAVFFSARNGSSSRIKFFLWLFVAVFILGVILDHLITFGKIIALAGSFGLIITHFFNIRSCRKCSY